MRSWGWAGPPGPRRGRSSVRTRAAGCVPVVDGPFAARLLSTASDELKGNDELRKAALVKQTAVRMLLPAQIGDYTDFYASRQHATNVGRCLAAVMGTAILPRLHA
jgi:hypothetical protein